MSPANGCNVHKAVLVDQVVPEDDVVVADVAAAVQVAPAAVEG